MPLLFCRTSSNVAILNLHNIHNDLGDEFNNLCLMKLDENAGRPDQEFTYLEEWYFDCIPLTIFIQWVTSCV